MDTMDRFRLDGRVALVTGGGRGIGLGMSSALAGAGADIVIVSRRAEEMTEPIATLEDLGRRVWAFSFDLSDLDGIPALYDRIVEATGGVDILVNNAGRASGEASEDLQMSDFDAILDIDLKSVFAMCQAFARERIATGRPGRIINVSSLTSECACGRMAAYGAAKAAVKQLTMTLAVEWAKHGINVNAIGPGQIATDLTRPAVEDAEHSRRTCGKTPLGRWGKPEDLGGATVFLASGASDFVTGQSIYVDGGWLALL